MAGSGRPALDDSSEYSVAARWIILVALMLGTILEVLDTSIVNVSIPQMMGNLGASINEIGWVSTSYIIANVIILPLTGWLSSYFGRRRYLTYSIAIFTIASFLCGTSRTLNGLVVFRVLQGIGGAALLSTAQATLLEVFPRKQIGAIQAIFVLGVVVAPTIGPTVGGWITDNYNWPWIFFVNIPIGAIAGLLVWNFLRDSKYQKAPVGRIDFVGIGLLAVGLGSLQTVLEKGDEEGWFQSNLILRFGFLAVVGLISFVWWELKIENPAVNLRILKNRGYSAGVLFAAVLGFGLYGGVFILPIFLQQIRGYTPTETGMLLFPSGVATVLALPFLGRITGKVSPRPLVFFGGAMFCTSLWLLTTLTDQTGPSQLYVSLIFRGVAMAFLFLPLTLATLTGLEPKDIAAGTGFFNLARQLGGSVGIAYLSTLLDHRSTIHRAAISEHISPYSFATQQRMALLEHAFVARGSLPAVAHKQAMMAITGIVNKQASVMAFSEGFWTIAVLFLCALPLVLLFRKGRMDRSAAAGAH